MIKVKDTKNKEKNIKKNFAIKLGALVLILAVGFGIIGGSVYYSRYKEMKDIVDVDTIYNNVFVDATNVGGLTKEQAVKQLQEKANSTIYSKTITLVCDDEEYKFTYSDLGVQLNIEKAVDDAYNYARSGSISKRYNMITGLDNQAYYIESEYSYDDDKIKEALKSLEEKVYKAPVNATVKMVNSELVTQPGEVGHKLNIDATVSSVKETLKVKNYDEDNVSIYILTEEIQPEYSEEDFANTKDIIGTYSTKYSGGASARVTNMKVAAQRLNETVLYPGEVFSTNACFGESTEANGYKPAGTILNGKLVDEYGGGVCQVSSTLYNAVLYAELDVVERQNHSIKVGYLDYGFDATLAGDYIDFKFKNSTQYPIYIAASVESGKVVCSIYGKEDRPEGRSIEFENELVETVSPGAEKITYDDSLEDGTRKTTVNALNGYKYKVYKLIYENGELTEKTLVNDSYYKPRAAEVTVGTKKEEEETEETTETSESTESTENNNSNSSSDEANSASVENTEENNQ